MNTAPTRPWRSPFSKAAAMVTALLVTAALGLGSAAGAAPAAAAEIQGPDAEASAEEDEVPFKTGGLTELVPQITNVYDAAEDSTSDVQIMANLAYDVALMDGRTLQITYPTWYRMTYQDGVWKAAGWSYMVADATSVIKK